MKRIEIEYYEDGSTKVETFGFDGASCIEATKEIVERHGQVQTIQHKPEFFEEEENLHDATKLCG